MISSILDQSMYTLRNDQHFEGLVSGYDNDVIIAGKEERCSRACGSLKTFDIKAPVTDNFNPFVRTVSATDSEKFFISKNQYTTRLQVIPIDCDFVCFRYFMPCFLGLFTRVLILLS